MPGFEQRILLFFLEPVSGALDRFHETQWQPQACAASTLTNYYLARDVAPVDNFYLPHIAACIAASSSGTISPMPVNMRSKRNPS